MIGQLRFVAGWFHHAIVENVEGTREMMWTPGRSGSLVGGVYSLGRVVLGFLFACHGAASLFGIWGGAMGTHGGTVAFGAWPGWWAAAIEFAGGLLVALGLVTRVAALLCSGAMAYAYFTVHIRHGLLPIVNGGEPAALYSWIFVMIAALGSGPIAVDAALKRRVARVGESVSEPGVAVPAAD